MNARKMGRRWLVMMMAMVVVMAGIGVAVAWAQQAPSSAGPCVRPGGILTQDDRDAIGRIILQRTKENLGLSDQQAEQIRTTLQSRRDDARADFQALCQARVDFRQLLDQQNSDPGALKDAADRVKLLQGKLLDRRLDTVVALRSQLSADQWTTWVEMRKARARRWMGRAPGLAS
jgi:hypothetical protein